MDSSPYENAEWLSAVYAMADEACVRDGALPPGLMGAMTRLIDEAQADRTDEAILARAHAMLVALHTLRAALRHDASNADPAAIRTHLRLLCREWIDAARFC